MVESEAGGSRDPRAPSAGAASPAAAELAAALSGLDRATRDFTRRLGEGQREVERARLAGEQAIDEAAQIGGAQSAAGSEWAFAAGSERTAAGPEPTAAGPEPTAAGPEPTAGRAPAAAVSTGARNSAIDSRMHEAELEARAYLESAKRRADSLVASMIAAFESEAAQARRDAEDAIRARWKQIELDAARQVENAHRVGAQMVAERQRRIAALSDGISDRAVALTAGMDDADRVRAQFDAFIRALAAAADRIAREPTERPHAPDGGGFADRPQRGVLAA